MRKALTFAVVYAALFLIHLALPAQGGISSCTKAKALIDRIQEIHFAPLPLDDVFSRDVFDMTLEALDPDKVYFTLEDVAALASFRTDLDAQVQRKVCEFPEALSSRFKLALERADRIAAEIATTPFDYNQEEFLIIAKDISYATDEKALQERWRKSIKYAALDYLFLVPGPDEAVTDWKAKKILAQEKEARAKMVRRARRTIDRLINHVTGLDTYVEQAYLSAICKRHDPHSTFFSLDEKERFEQNLSTKSEYFGFSLGETKVGQIEVTRLMPGGAAWKSNQVHKGDILLACKFPTGEKYDLTDMDLREFNNVLGEPSLKRMELKLQKKDGQVQKVSLIKTKLRNEESIVKTLVLAGTPKVGYLSLPGFYSDWENDKGSSCANDVAKGVVKLKQEGVEGLILDLRDNSGGSMTEAMDLAGIFVDRGPLMIQRARNEEPRTYKDKNLGFVWRGPLVVLVNGLSASASEFVAAILQDHRKAVIVGSPTYGKATSQAFFPLDPVFDSERYNFGDVDPDWGFAKLTLGRFNRLDGNSHQKKGVQPDILLPGLFEGLGFQEASKPHAFEPDYVEKKTYFTPGPELPLDELRNLSQDRVDNDNRFIQVVMVNDTLQNMAHAPEKSIPLSLESYRKKLLTPTSTRKPWESLNTEPTSIFSIQNTRSEKALIEMDTYRKETNEDLINKLLKDFYLEEAYQVVSDLVKMDY